MTATRSRYTAATLVAALALGACAAKSEALVARGADPAYAEGYDDGCSSGNAAGGSPFADARKDASRYDRDGQYAEGWDAGFAKCRRDMAAMVSDARRRNPSRDK
jgi:hypothetical protein